VSAPSRPTVLLDTNILFLPVRGGFPLVREIDRLVPGARVIVAESTLREHDRLRDRSTPDSAVARSLADRFDRVPAVREGDSAVLEVALREGAVVVTADRALEARLRSAGISVLVPRDRHRLELLRARSVTPSRPGPHRRVARAHDAPGSRRGNG